jgi:hypothetical protein
VGGLVLEAERREVFPRRNDLARLVAAWSWGAELAQNLSPAPQFPAKVADDLVYSQRWLILQGVQRLLALQS